MRRTVIYVRCSQVVSSVIVGLSVLSLFASTVLNAAEAGNVSRSGFSHYIALDYYSDKSDQDGFGYDSTSQDTTLSYAYALRPVVNNNKPIDEAFFLQRISLVSVSYGKGAGELKRYGEINSSSDDTEQGVYFFYANPNSPLTASAGLLKGSNESKSATSSFSSTGDRDGKVINFGYYLSSVSRISIHYIKYDYDYTSSTDPAFSSSSKNRGLSFRHYEQLDSEQAFVLGLGYDRSTYTSDARSSTSAGNNKNVDLTYYPSARTGLSLNYIMLDTDDSKGTYTRFGMSHYITEQLQLNASYSILSDDLPDASNDKTLQAGFIVRF